MLVPSPFRFCARCLALTGIVGLTAWSPPLLGQGLVAPGTPTAADGFLPAVNGTVNALQIQPNNQILVAGAFSIAQSNGSTTPQAVANIIRLNTDGSIDPTFNASTDGQIYSMLLEPNGQILIGGAFANVDGVGRSQIARLNADGSLDTTFNPDATAQYSAQVYAIALQSNGQILIGGAFTSLQPNGATGPTVRNHIARLNPDGSLDASFDPNASATVLTIAVQGNGQILIGGAFTSLQPNGAVTSTVRNHIARLNSDGTLDAVFNPSTDLSVSAIAVQANGQILVGGAFNTFQPDGASTPTTAPCFARLDSNGTLDSTFTLPVPNGAVNAILIQPDGRALIGGAFNELTPSTGSEATVGTYLARINPDGTSDVYFDEKISVNGQINALAVQVDGKVICGGEFNDVGSALTGAAVPGASLARFDDDGTPDLTFDPNLYGAVSAIGVQSTGMMIVGGSFSSIGGITVHALARINASGTVDPTFQANVTLDGSVTALAIQSDDSIIIAGTFGNVDGTLRNGLARLNSDGTLDTTFDPNPNGSGTVDAVVVQGDGKILLGGNFTTLQPNGATSATTRDYIARVNTDGTLDTTFDPEANSTVSTIVLESNGQMMVGGQFTSFSPNQPPNGTTSPTDTVYRSYVARLNNNGTVDASFYTTPGGTVNSIAIQSNGDIVLAGSFTYIFPNSAINYTDVDYIARVTSTGALDSSFLPAFNSTISQVALTSSGQIYAAGTFTQTAASSANPNWVNNAYLTRLNTDGSFDTSFNPAPNGGVDLLYLPSSSQQVFAAGSYTGIGGGVISRLAELNPNGSLDSAFNLNAAGFAGSQVQALAVNTIQQILLGGNLPSGLGGSASAYLMRFNSDGTTDGSFSAEASGPSGNTYVDALLNLPAGASESTQLSGFAWLNSTGTLDTNFSVAAGFEISGTINGVAVDTTNDFVYLAGDFNTSSTAFTGDLVRLSYAGVPDPNFAPIINGAVDAVAVQPADQKVLIGGDFTDVQGNGATAATRNFIARFNEDGSLDTSFNPDLNGEVFAIVVQPNGQILVGGEFTGAQPNAVTTVTTRFYLLRLNSDGTLDTTFNPTPNGNVDAIALQSNGQVLVGGEFTELAPNGTTTETLCHYFARLNTDGTLDTTFDPEPNAEVVAILVQPNGDIVIGGDFSALEPGLNKETDNGTTVPASIKTVDRNYIARVDSTGDVDTTFNPSPDSTVNALALAPDNSSIFVGGDFAEFGVGVSAVPTPRSYLALLSQDGTVEQNFDPELDNDVNSITILDTADSENGGYSVLVSGFFSTVQPTGSIVAGGSFTGIGTAAINNLAELRNDGTAIDSFSPDPNGPINALALQANGQILAGGAFTTVQPSNATSPIACNYLARLNPDGSLDPFYNSGASAGPNGPVYAVALQANGQAIVGGSFTTVGGQAQAYLARFNVLDGSLDPSFAPVIVAPTGVVAVDAIAIQADGRIVIGGAFTGVDGAPQAYLARLNPDGSLDSTFTPTIQGGTVATIAVATSTGTSAGPFSPSFPPGQSLSVTPGLAQIVIGGSFTSVTGTDGTSAALNYIARLNGDGTIDLTFNPSADAPISTLAVQPDGKTLVGGSFGNIGGEARFRFARLASTVLPSQAIGINTNLSQAVYVRSAGGPELAQVLFQTSPDGINWSVPMPGTRLGNSSDWIFQSALPIGEVFYIQATGVLATSQGGSSGLVTYYTAFFPVTPLAALVGPASLSATVGQPFYYAPAATPTPTGYALAGLPAGSGLSFNSTTGVISGTPTAAGTYDLALTMTDAAGQSVTNLVLTVGSASTAPPVSSAGRLLDVAMLGEVTTTDNPITVGFWITGGDKTVLLGGLGPGISSLLSSGTGNPDNPEGVTGPALPNPEIQLYDAAGDLLLQNSGWDQTSALGAIQTSLSQADLSASMTGALPFTTGDAGLVTVLPPGGYTMIIYSNEGTESGMALAEVFDADANPLSLPQQISGISARGLINPKAASGTAITSGFTISGGSQTMLFRASGPALMADYIGDPLDAPVLSIYDANGNLLAQNSAWGTQPSPSVNPNYPNATPAQIISATSSCGLTQFNGGSNDAALLITLPAGVYTAQVTSGDGTSGESVFEGYEVPQ